MFDDISFNKSYGCKIFEGELFIKTLSTTLLQIVCKLMLHTDLEDQTQVDSKPASQPEHASLN